MKPTAQQIAAAREKIDVYSPSKAAEAMKLWKGEGWHLAEVYIGILVGMQIAIDAKEIIDMPKGEATREAIESLMAATDSLDVFHDDGEYIRYYTGERTADGIAGMVLGVVLVCKDKAGEETGRMIAQIRAVTTKQEQDEADKRFKEMNP